MVLSISFELIFFRYFIYVTNLVTYYLFLLRITNICEPKEYIWD